MIKTDSDYLCKPLAIILLGLLGPVWCEVNIKQTLDQAAQKLARDLHTSIDYYRPGQGIQFASANGDAAGE